MNFSKCKVIVLTSDNKLCYWNHKKHEKDKSIQECISNQQLVNLLWFNNPSILGDKLPNIIISLSGKYDEADVINKLAYAFRIYEARYKNNPEKIDRLSLLYAHNIDNIDDLFNSESDDDYISFIEEKVRQVHLREKQSEVDNKRIILDEKRKRLEEKIKTRKYLEPFIKDINRDIKFNKIIFFVVIPLIPIILFMLKIFSIRIINTTIDDMLTYTSLIGAFIKPVYILVYNKNIELHNIWINMNKTIIKKHNKKRGFNITSDWDYNEESINNLTREINALETEISEIDSSFTG